MSEPLTPAAAAELAAALRARGAAFRRLPAREILEALGTLHDAWAAPASALRAGAVTALHQQTGFAARALDESLRGLFAAMREAELDRWLALSGIPPAALDDGLRDAGGSGALLVYGPALTVVVASGNLPGAALPSVVQALLLKSPCLAKSATAEPLLLPLYARSLAARCPELGACLAAVTWPGGSESVEAAVLARAEALLAYGSDAALRDLRCRLPVGARFIGYGHRISFSAIARECLTAAAADELAARAAEDACVLDQQGCLSPQAVYVESGGGVEATAFAERLAAALAERAGSLPRRPLPAGEAAAIHQYRARMELRTPGEPGVRLWCAPGGTAWTVALEPEPELRPCCLHRTVVVHPIATLEALPALLAPRRGELISAGLEAGPERRPALAGALAAAGVTRITRVGRAQAPESPLFHDGRSALAALARFVRVEPE